MPSRRILPSAVSRASRPYFRSCCPNVPSCDAVPWKDPWWWVRPSTIARRRSSGSWPGNVVQPVPIAAAAWASLLPTVGRPCSAANRTTRPCHGRPSVVGLKASSASGRKRGSGSAMSRRRTQPWAQSGYGTSGWAGIARPPWSWIAAIVERSDWSGFTRSVRKRPSRWPPRVVTSSPTTTWARRPRSREIARAASAASIRSWSVIAMTSRSVERSTWSRISTIPAVPSDASVWMWRSARPSFAVTPRPPARPLPGRLTRRAPGVARRGRVHSLSGRLRLEVRPDRGEDRAPLVRGVGDQPLEGRGLGGDRRLDPLAARALGRDRDLVEAAAVRQPARPPDAREVDRRAGVDREERGPDRDRRRRAEERHLDPAAADVAVGHEPDVLAALQRGRQLAARLAERHDPDAEHGPGPLEPALQLRVAERLHRRDDGPAAGAVGEVEAGHLDRPEVAADEHDRDVAGERGFDALGVLDDDPVLELREVEARRPQDLEVVAGVLAERRPDEALERPRVGRRGPRPGIGEAVVGRGSGRRGGGCAGPGRLARARGGTTAPRTIPRSRRAALRGDGRRATTRSSGHAPGAAGPACLERDEPRRRSRLRGPQVGVDGGRVGGGGISGGAVGAQATQAMRPLPGEPARTRRRRASPRPVPRARRPPPGSGATSA